MDTPLSNRNCTADSSGVDSDNHPDVNGNPFEYCDTSITPIPDQHGTDRGLLLSNKFTNVKLTRRQTTDGSWRVSLHPFFSWHSSRGDEYDSSPVHEWRTRVPLNEVHHTGFDVEDRSGITYELSYLEDNLPGVAEAWKQVQGDNLSFQLSDKALKESGCLTFSLHSMTFDPYPAYSSSKTDQYGYLYVNRYNILVEDRRELARTLGMWDTVPPHLETAYLDNKLSTVHGPRGLRKWQVTDQDELREAAKGLSVDDHGRWVYKCADCGAGDSQESPCVL